MDARNDCYLFSFQSLPRIPEASALLRVCVLTCVETAECRVKVRAAGKLRAEENGEGERQ